LGSYLRDALHEGSIDAVACLGVPRAYGPMGVFPPFSFLLGGFNNCTFLFEYFDLIQFPYSKLMKQIKFTISTDDSRAASTHQNATHRRLGDPI
jgi:hypothetical protein